MAESKFRLARFLLLSPFFAAYGAWVLLCWAFRVLRSIVWTIRLANPRLICPACGKVNSLYGRWECRAPGCGAVYLGAADRCGRCGAGASFFPCASCGASITLRPARW
jgi:hypothetical protein